MTIVPDIKREISSGANFDAWRPSITAESDSAVRFASRLSP